ncbi:MAG: hypothetical protein ACLRSW_17750 [Christensenellaceae bacterium]
MLTHEATRSEIEEWKRIFEEYRGKIRPCRRSGEELVAYLKKRYSAVRTDEGKCSPRRRETLSKTNVPRNSPKEKSQRGGLSSVLAGRGSYVGWKRKRCVFWNLRNFRPTKRGFIRRSFLFRGLTKRISKIFLVAEYVRAAESTDCGAERTELKENEKSLKG